MSADNWGKCPRCGKDDVLREDYEQGIYEGEYLVNYSGVCRDPESDKCRFEFHYRHKEPVK